MFLTLVSLLIGSASAQTPPLRSDKALSLDWSSSGKTKNLAATLASGFHFNNKAPNGIQFTDFFVKPTDFEPKKLDFKNLPNSDQGMARFYICDDQESFCEIQTLNLQNSKANPLLTKSKLSTHKNEFGFLIDNFPLALNTAQKKHQIVLIDFGARWCPACLRLEEDVFANPEFQKLSDTWVLLKLDVDQFQNQPFLEKYKIQGFPTLLFINDAGDEVLRVTDYQPLARWLQLHDEVIHEPRSLAELAKDASGKSVLGRRYAEAGLWSEWLSLHPKKPESSEDPAHHWQEAQFETKLQALQKKAEPWKDSDLGPLLAQIQVEPESTRSLRFRQELIEKIKTQPELNTFKTNLKQESENLTVRLLADSHLLEKAIEFDNLGEFTGLEAFYVAFTMAETAELSEQNEVAAWTRAYRVARDLKIPASDLGPSLRWLTCAINSHQNKEALKLVNQLIRHHPQTGDLDRRKLKILVALRRFKEAVAVGRHALSNSYGYNEFLVVEPFAQALIANGQKAQAQELLKDYLDRPEMSLQKSLGLQKKLSTLLTKAGKP